MLGKGGAEVRGCLKEIRQCSAGPGCAPDAPGAAVGVRSAIAPVGGGPGGAGSAETQQVPAVENVTTKFLPAKRNPKFVALAEAVHHRKDGISAAIPLFSDIALLRVRAERDRSQRALSRFSPASALTDHDRQFRGSEPVSSYAHLSMTTRRHDPQGWWRLGRWTRGIGLAGARSERGRPKRKWPTQKSYHAKIIVQNRNACG